MKRIIQYDNEFELIVALKKGEHDAYSYLFSKYYNDLVLYGGTIIQNQEVCEDIVQNIFLYIWDNRESIQIKSLKSYLLRAVRNSCFDEIKHYKIVNEHTDFVTRQNTLEINDTEEYILFSELNAKLQEAIEMLPEEEKKALFQLLKEFYKKEIKRLISNNILVKHIGDISAFPKDTINTIVETEKETLEKCKNPILTVVLALNYGFRDELKNAIKNICNDAKNNTIDIENIDENTIKDYLYTKEMPDPDLIIRTSGEARLSNFLMYQASYSELYFTDVLWPDFSKDNFKQAIEEYSNRNRRYGGL